MRQIFLFEGVERIGKTTLINQFMKQRPGITLASLRPIRHLIKTHNVMGSQVLFPTIAKLNRELLDEINEMVGVNTIYVDRWFVSEAVYQYSYFKCGGSLSFPINLVLYVLLGPDSLEFYQEHNTPAMAVRAYLDNKLFSDIVLSYQQSDAYKPLYKVQEDFDLPRKEDVRIYKITKR